MGDAPVRPNEDRHELVSAVAIQPVAVSRGVCHRFRDADQERVTGGVTARVVEGLEPVEVEHEHREGPAAAPIRDRLAELALERAVVAQTGQGIEVGADADRAVRLCVLEGDRGLAGEQLGQLELVGAEGCFGIAHPADVQGADGRAVDDERDDDHRLGLERRARDLDRARVEVRLIGEDGLAVVDHPATDPGAERALVGEDQVGEPVAGDDRAADAGGPVDLVDGQRVVWHDRPQRIGDEVEHAGRLERRQQTLVDLEQSSLALELVLELVLLCGAAAPCSCR